MTTEQAERWRLRRDALIVSFSLTAAGIEIFFLGARPAVLTFLTGLVFSPVAMRVDELRKRDQ